MVLVAPTAQVSRTNATSLRLAITLPNRPPTKTDRRETTLAHKTCRCFTRAAYAISRTPARRARMGSKCLKRLCRRHDAAAGQLSNAAVDSVIHPVSSATVFGEVNPLMWAGSEASARLFSDQPSLMVNVVFCSTCLKPDTHDEWPLLACCAAGEKNCAATR
jgi:hypothetical protein